MPRWRCALCPATGYEPERGAALRIMRTHYLDEHLPAEPNTDLPSTTPKGSH